MAIQFEVPRKVLPQFRRDAVAGFSAGIYTGGIIPFYLIIARDRLAMSELLISLVVAAPFIGNLLALFWANAMEGRPKMPFVVWSGIIGRGMFLLMVFAITPLSYAIIVCASLFLGTIASPAYAAIMKDIYPDTDRGRLMGYVRVLMALSTILTTLIAGVALKGDNYRFVFPIAAFFGMASSWAFGAIKTSQPTKKEIDSKGSASAFLRSSFRVIVKDRSFTWFALSVFTYGFGVVLMTPIVPVFQVDRLHISTTQAGVLSCTQSVVWMLSYLFWGRYVDTHNPLKATVINVSLSILIPITYFAAPSWHFLFPAFILGGVTAAGLELAYFNSVLMLSGDAAISQYQAIFSWLLGIRGAVAPFVATALMTGFAERNWDFRYIFVLTATVMAIGAAMQMRGLKRYEKGEKI